MGGVQGDALVAAPRSMAAWADGRAGGSMGRGFIGLRHLLAHDFAMESFVPRRAIVCKGRHASPPQWPVSHIYRPHLSSRSEEHTSELQSRGHLICRLLLEKKSPNNNAT